MSATSATFSFSATEPATFQCRLDGAAFAPCTSPMSYTNLTAGSHTFQVAATDASFNVDATPAARSWTVVDPGSDLVGNPGFEVDTSGWAGRRDDQHAEPGGGRPLGRLGRGDLEHPGRWELRARRQAELGGRHGGRSYTASIWARSDTPGLTLRLRMREYVSGVQQGSVTSSVALTSSWQQVTAVYTPVARRELSSLDFEAFTANSPVGVCFQADDASTPSPRRTRSRRTRSSTRGPWGSCSTRIGLPSASRPPSRRRSSAALDGGPFAPCTSPTSYANLAIGTHTFQVAATDGSSNVDATAERQLDRAQPPHWSWSEPGLRGGHVRLGRRRGGQHGQPGRRRPLGGWAAAISNTWPVATVG